MNYCCSNCFSNSYIKQYINDNSEEIGACSYCGSKNTPIISTKALGEYMRECISKAYEKVDELTGAYYEPEEGGYLGRKGEDADIYSIRDILETEEMIFSDSVDESLIEDLFENQYSYREIQKGAEDPYSDIDSPEWVIQNDLYGSEQTRLFHSWETFKHIVKHYSRFYDFETYNLREGYLETLNPYIYDSIEIIHVGTRFYRAREKNDSIGNIDEMEPYSKMGPPPAHKAKTNRMSPAGIPYLYVAEDIDTSIAECRIKPNHKAIIAEFETKTELEIIDFSKNIFYSSDSIFDPDYNQDTQWINDFLGDFIYEISQPVSDDKSDNSYEYTATQLIAEYYRQNYDGICFKSSVGKGKSYVFFYGPDPQYTENAYPYPFNDIYFGEKLPYITPFTEVFKINKLEEIEVDATFKSLKTRNI